MGPVKEQANIKLECDLGQGILAALAVQKPSKLCRIRITRTTIYLIKRF